MEGEGSPKSPPLSLESMSPKPVMRTGSLNRGQEQNGDKVQWSNMEVSLMHAEGVHIPAHW